MDETNETEGTSEENSAPSGLNLLVAALDAHDPKAFRFQSVIVPATSAKNDSASTSKANGRFSESPTSRSSDDYSAFHSNSSLLGRRRSIPDNSKNDAYWEKRRRNNEAAKKSREKRRFNDMAIESRLYQLTKENNILKDELVLMKQHTLQPVAAGSAAASFIPPRAGGNLPTLPLSPAAVCGSTTAGPSLPLQNAALTVPLTLLPPFSIRTSSICPAKSALGATLPLLVPPILPPNQIIPANLSAHSGIPQPILGSGPESQDAASATPTEHLLYHSESNGIYDNVCNKGIHMENGVPQTPPGLVGVDGGKQYLRYKLLERQNRLTTVGRDKLLQATSPPQNLTFDAAGGSPGSIFGRKLALTNPVNECNGHTVKPASAESLSLKDCLSNFFVELDTGHKAVDSRLENDHSTIAADPSSSPSRSPRHSEEDHGYDTQDKDRNSSGSEGSCHDSSSSCTISENYCPRFEVASVENSLKNAKPLKKTAAKRSNSYSCGISGNYCEDFRPTDLPLLTGGIDGGSANGGGTGGNSSGGSGSETERYIERRRRNNEAAKRCRANRRALFEFRFQRAQELEQENGRLKDAIKRLTQEVGELKSLLLAKSQTEQRQAQKQSEERIFGGKLEIVVDSYQNEDQDDDENDNLPLDFSKKKRASIA